jgi:hypothetical protein
MSPSPTLSPGLVMAEAIPIVQSNQRCSLLFCPCGNPTLRWCDTLDSLNMQGIILVADLHDQEHVSDVCENLQ